MRITINQSIPAIKIVGLVSFSLYVVATCEMVKIMQEYGEVVLCLGSSVNISNTGIFLQADARSENIAGV